MLATLNQLKTYLWISWNWQDSMLNIFLKWADQIIKTYLWRDIEEKEYVEVKDGNAQRFFVLNQYPIIEIKAVYYNSWTGEEPNWEEVNKGSLEVSPLIWKLYFRSPIIRWFQNYKIEYTAWYSEIPADLTLATIKMASRYYNNSTSDWVKSETVNGDSISFDSSEIPSDIMVVLSNYRDV